jgi:hypothetical protein
MKISFIIIIIIIILFSPNMVYDASGDIPMLKWRNIRNI